MEESDVIKCAPRDLSYQSIQEYKQPENQSKSGCALSTCFYLNLFRAKLSFFISTHLKLCLATAMHNFNRVKITFV